MIRFTCIALFVVFFLIVSLPIQLAEFIIGKFHPEIRDRSSLAIVNWAFRVVLFLAGTSVTVLGEENVPKDEAVLYVGNHRSYFDILLTYVRVPRPTGYMAKVEMLRYPSLSTWMKYLHCIFLDRRDIKAGMKSILNAIEKVKPSFAFSRREPVIKPTRCFWNSMTEALRLPRNPAAPSFRSASTTPAPFSKIIFPGSRRLTWLLNMVHPSTRETSAKKKSAV